MSRPLPRRLAPLLRYLLGLRAWTEAEREHLTHVARDCYHAGYAAGYQKGRKARRVEAVS